jgi:hypothetical protein
MEEIMPKIIVDNTKGLHQASGAGFVSTITDHGAVANGAVTLTAGEMINTFQSGGGSTAVTVSTTSALEGQIVIFINNHATNTSTVNGATVAAGTAAILVYDGTAWRELVSG